MDKVIFLSLFLHSVNGAAYFIYGLLSLILSQQSWEFISKCSSENEKIRSECVWQMLPVITGNIWSMVKEVGLQISSLKSALRAWLLWITTVNWWVELALTGNISYYARNDVVTVLLLLMCLLGKQDNLKEFLSYQQWYLEFKNLILN